MPAQGFMIGLENRLRNVVGVERIVVELDDQGLSAIRVSIDAGSDEAQVLEGIRSILGTYGLRGGGRRPSITELPDLTPADLVPDLMVAVERLVHEQRPEISIRPDGLGNLALVLTRGDVAVEEHSDATPAGVTRAMAVAVAKLEGLAPPDRISLLVDLIDGARVLTTLAKQGDRMAAGAAVASTSPAAALYDAVHGALIDLDRQP